MEKVRRRELVADIAETLNRLNIERLSNTPDFILAEYLVKCLENYNAAIVDRNNHFYVPGRTNFNVIDPMKPNDYEK